MNPELSAAVDYVRQHLANGVPEQQIRDHFLASGWPAQMVDQVFSLTRPPAPGLSPSPYQPAPYQSPYPAAQASPYPQPEQSQTPVGTAAAKYRVFPAIGDAVKAIRFNWRAYFGSLVLSYIIAIGSFTIILTTYTLTAGPRDGQEVTLHSRSAAAYIFLLLLFWVWYSLVLSFMLNTSLLVLQDSVAKRRSHIIDVLKRSLRILPRVAIAQALSSVIAMFPLIILVLILIWNLATSFSGSGPNINPIIYLILIPVAFVWILIAYLRLALVAQIAALEPATPMRRIFGRSSFLLAHGGQWFIIKGVCLVSLVVIVLSLVSHTTPQQLQTTDNVFIILLLVIVNLVSEATLTMLYFNRAAVRGRLA